MWCLVRLPNCVVVDVGVDSKAAGQEVLDRVSIDFFSVILLTIVFVLQLSQIYLL